MLTIDDNVGSWIVHNGVLLTCVPEETMNFDFTGPIIYEVIRYINKRGLFKEDHLDRLDRSAEG